MAFKLKIFFLIAVVLGLSIYHFYRKQQEKALERVLRSRYPNGEGWIEIATDDLKPIFQGHLLRLREDKLGVCVGVLLEKDVNTQFLQDLKAARKITYLEPGKIVCKAIIDFQAHIVMTDFKDPDLRKAIEQRAEPDQNIDVKIMLSSRELQFVNSVEDEQTFAELENGTGS